MTIKTLACVGKVAGWMASSTTEGCFEVSVSRETLTSFECEFIGVDLCLNPLKTKTVN